jgi:hypothetical protein
MLTEFLSETLKKGAHDGMSYNEEVDLERQVMRYELESLGTGWRPLTVSYEYENEPSRCIKGGEFLGYRAITSYVRRTLVPLELISLILRFE